MRTLSTLGAIVSSSIGALVAHDTAWAQAPLPATPERIMQPSDQSKDRAALIREIELNLRSLDSIPKEALKEPEVLAACLQSVRLTEETGKLVTLEHLDSPLVRSGVINFLLHTSSPGITKMLGHDPRWFDHEQFRKELVTWACENPEKGLSKVSSLMIGDNPDIPTKYHQEICDNIREPFFQLIATSADQDAEEFPYVVARLPVRLKRDPELSERIAKVIESRSTLELYRALYWMSLPPERIQSILDQAITDGKFSPEQLSTITPRGSSIGVKKEKQLHWMRTVSTSELAFHSIEELIKDPEIAAIFIERVIQDPRMGASCDNIPTVRAALLKAAENEATIDSVVAEVKKDVGSLCHYPDLIARIPRVRHAAHEQVNYLLARGRSLPGESDVSRGVKARYMADVLPDALGLLYSEESRQGVCFDKDQIAIFNPRFAKRMMADAKVFDTELADGLNRVAKISALLGIYGFDRFDNAREIIRNRYAIAPESVRAQLREIIGDRYFGHEKFFDGIDQDTRPPLVAIFASAGNDYNGAFLAREQIINADNIDSLTSHYRVFYFEASADYEAIGHIIATSRAFGRPLELAVFGGHGWEQGISFGWGDGDGELGVGDTKLMQELSESFAPGARLYLLSCSTAGKPEHGKRNIAETLQGKIPNLSVIGPNEPTNGKFILDRNGAIKTFEYLGAHRIVYRSDGTRVVEDKTSWIGFALQNIPITTEYRIRHEFFKFLGLCTLGYIGATLADWGRRQTMRKIRTAIKNRNYRRMNPTLWDQKST